MALGPAADVQATSRRWANRGLTWFGLFRPGKTQNAVLTVSHNMSYAVRTVPARCRTQKPVSPAAAWYCFMLLHKKFTKWIFC